MFFARALLRLFGIRFETGTLTLLINGPTAIEVTTGFTPKDVWINAGTAGGVPVCNGDTDLFDVWVVPNGFVILVRMNSEMREIQWVARN